VDDALHVFRRRILDIFCELEDVVLRAHEAGMSNDEIREEADYIVERYEEITRG
jgi:hypothetical protein